MQGSTLSVDYRRSVKAESRCAPTCSVRGCENVAVWLYTRSDRPYPHAARLCGRCRTEFGPAIGLLAGMFGVRLTFTPLPLVGAR